MESNADIIALAKDGNQDALEQIYTENANKVYFLCLKILKNSDDACDVMQDTFIRAFSNLEQLKNSDALSSWLLSIATSLCKNLLVKNKKYVLTLDNEESTVQIQNIEDSDDNVLPEQYADNAEKRRLVMQIIDNLPDSQRIAIILFYYNGMSIKDIADVLECSEQAVKSRLYYGRKTIKEEVLNLEEKGTKLYGVPVIPLLGSILNYEAIETIAPAMSSSLAASLMQAAKTSTNVQSAATAKAAETGGKAMTKMTKIIIAALAAVVVAGGAITAAVIANNNNSVQTQGLTKNESEKSNDNKDESSKNDDDGSAKSSKGNDESHVETSSKTENSEPSSEENSEEKLKAEEEALAQEIHAQLISCGLYNPEDLGFSSDSENKKYTRLTFMFTAPNRSSQAYDILNGKASFRLYEKNGTMIDAPIPQYYKMNDNSCVCIVKIKDEYDIDDMDLKLYFHKTKNAYDLKEFNRSEAKLNYATGQITSGDYVKINGNPYIYVGLALTSGGITNIGTGGNDVYFDSAYHEFISLSSNTERLMTGNEFQIDYSKTTSLPKSEYPLEAKLSINDEESVKKVSRNKTIEVCMFETSMIVPSDEEVDNLDEISKRDAEPYTDALMVVYEDKNSDYSFSFDFMGSKPSGY